MDTTLQPSGDLLRVFISGTQEDLIMERDTASSVIRALGFVPLRAEKHSSVAASPYDVCIELAKTCDLYLGLYGGRYGRIPERMLCSVTEMEYDAACASEPSKILIYRSETADIEPAQRGFLNKVQSFDKGYFRRPPFLSVEQLAQYLREDIPRWITQRIRRLPQLSKAGGHLPTAGSYLPSTRTRRPPSPEEIGPLLHAAGQGRSDLSVEVLKDFEALSYSVAVEQNEEVLRCLTLLLRGAIETRVQALRTLRVFLSVADSTHREYLHNRFRQAILYQFVNAKDVQVKQAAMNVLGAVITIDDLDTLLHYIAATADEVYRQCLPFPVLDALRNAGHEAKVRGELYNLKEIAADEKMRKRMDELLEYLRWKR